MQRSIIYARKSTDDPKNQQRSLGDQLAECFEYAEKNNLVLGRPSQLPRTSREKPCDYAQISIRGNGATHSKFMWCPRRESNLDRLVRSEAFYPLNYGGPALA